MSILELRKIADSEVTFNTAENTKSFHEFEFNEGEIVTFSENRDSKAFEGLDDSQIKKGKSFYYYDEDCGKDTQRFLKMVM